MNVYAYFDSCCVSEVARHTLDLWEKSWKDRGWNPIILCEKDAESHPFYPRFRDAIRSFPSVNGPGFDYHAFMRWLAVANLKNSFVVTTEPDVINYSLVSDDVMKFCHGIDVHSPVPAFLVGLPSEFELFCAHVMAHELAADDAFEGKPHLSDQDFAARYAEPRGLLRFVRDSNWCHEAFSDKWENAPCVHFGTPYMMSRDLLPKHEHIPILRPLP